MRRGAPAHDASTDQILQLRDQGLSWTEVADQVGMTLLLRDCEASKVPIAVEDPNAIKRIVRLITKAGDRRDAT
jgi:transcriptional regulator